MEGLVTNLEKILNTGIVEKTLIKKNWVDSFHLVTPFQNVFHEECSEADLDTDVLEVLSVLQSELIKGLISGACIFSQLRKSKDVMQKDLLGYIDAIWNIDPLLVSEKFYRTEETRENVDASVPKKSPQKQKRRCSSSSNKAHKTATKKDIHSDISDLKESPSASMCTLKLKVEKECSTNKTSMEVSPFKEKAETEFQIANQHSTENLHADSKVYKTPKKKCKQVVICPAKTTS